MSSFPVPRTKNEEKALQRASHARLLSAGFNGNTAVAGSTVMRPKNQSFMTPQDLESTRLRKEITSRDRGKMSPITGYFFNQQLTPSEVLQSKLGDLFTIQRFHIDEVQHTNDSNHHKSDRFIISGIVKRILPSNQQDKRLATHAACIVSDLKGNDALLHLYDDSMSMISRLREGYIIILGAPQISEYKPPPVNLRKPRSGPPQKPFRYVLTIRSAEQILLEGVSSDLGPCVAFTTGGTRCQQMVNYQQTMVCDYHLQKELKLAKKVNTVIGNEQNTNTMQQLQTISQTGAAGNRTKPSDLYMKRPTNTIAADPQFTFDSLFGPASTSMTTTANTSRNHASRGSLPTSRAGVIKTQSSDPFQTGQAPLRVPSLLLAEADGDGNDAENHSLLTKSLPTGQRNQTRERREPTIDIDDPFRNPAAEKHQQQQQIESHHSSKTPWTKSRPLLDENPFDMSSDDGEQQASTHSARDNHSTIGGSGDNDDDRYSIRNLFDVMSSDDDNDGHDDGHDDHADTVTTTSELVAQHSQPLPDTKGRSRNASLQDSTQVPPPSRPSLSHQTPSKSIHDIPKQLSGPAAAAEMDSQDLQPPQHRPPQKPPVKVMLDQPSQSPLKPSLYSRKSAPTAPASDLQQTGQPKRSMTSSSSSSSSLSQSNTPSKSSAVPTLPARTTQIPPITSLGSHVTTPHHPPHLSQTPRQKQPPADPKARLLDVLAKKRNLPLPHTQNTPLPSRAGSGNVVQSQTRMPSMPSQAELRENSVKRPRYSSATDVSTSQQPQSSQPPPQQPPSSSRSGTTANAAPKSISDLFADDDNASGSDDDSVPKMVPLSKEVRRTLALENALESIEKKRVIEEIEERMAQVMECNVTVYKCVDPQCRASKWAESKSRVCLANRHEIKQRNVTRRSFKCKTCSYIRRTYDMPLPSPNLPCRCAGDKHPMWVQISDYEGRGVLNLKHAQDETYSSMIVTTTSGGQLYLRTDEMLGDRTPASRDSRTQSGTSEQE